jgi:hypothetical protein
MPLSNVTKKQNVAPTESRTPTADELKASPHLAARLLSLPVRGLEKLGAVVIDWLEGEPESDTAWMHTTRFPSDKIRQECIDGFWEEKERAAREAKRKGV